MQDVTQLADGTTTVSDVPACSDASPPCWRIEAKDSCQATSPQGIGLTVDRGGATAPPDTTTRFYCDR